MLLFCVKMNLINYEIYIYYSQVRDIAHVRDVMAVTADRRILLRDAYY